MASAPSLRPEVISFALERQRHAGFVGRDRLLARLDQLLVADTVDRWVVVTGGPGMGKSAVLAAWLARREAAGSSVPHHFIRRGFANWDDPEAIVGSLVAQTAARFPDLREPEADARLAPVARSRRLDQVRLCLRGGLHPRLPAHAADRAGLRGERSRGFIASREQSNSDARGGGSPRRLAIHRRETRSSHRLIIHRRETRSPCRLITYR